MIISVNITRYLMAHEIFYLYFLFFSFFLNLPVQKECGDDPERTTWRERICTTHQTLNGKKTLRSHNAQSLYLCSE